MRRHPYAPARCISSQRLHSPHGAGRASCHLHSSGLNLFNAVFFLSGQGPRRARRAAMDGPSEAASSSGAEW
eukprot:5156377-Pyramimonas_sp.AAC.1